MIESVILCEGYLDRAFWKGWLEYVNFSNLGREARDPWGKSVGQGKFAFRSIGGQFLRVEPCHGRPNVLPALKLRLDGLQTASCDRIVVNTDSDSEVGEGDSHELTSATVLDIVKQKYDSAATLGNQGDISLLSGSCTVSCISWKAGDPPTDFLPKQENLERLVCAAIVSAYPNRAEPITEWLRSRPEAPNESPKEFAWSHMAGWYADKGCEAFYSYLWQDDKIVEQLKTRLIAAGAWRVVEELAKAKPN